MDCLRGIFFDLDDTLINSSAAMHAALEAIQPELPNQSPLQIAEALTQAYHQLWGYGTPGYFELKTLPTEQLRNQLTQKALTSLGVMERERFIRIQRLYSATEEATLCAVPGAHEVLATLRGSFSLGVITNGPSHIQREKLVAVGLTSYFDVIIADADFGAPKPDPALFAYAAGKLSLEPGELLFVGDSPEADIAGARAAGWQSAYIGPKVCPSATFQLTKLTELLDLPALQRTKDLHLEQRSPIL